jgi:hypothetical protein
LGQAFCTAFQIDYLAYAVALSLKPAWGDHLVSAMSGTVIVGE